MLVRRRRATFEQIERDAAESFVVRRFRWPCFPFHWHHHPEAELTLIVKGAGRRFVGDSIEDYAGGDLVLLGPDVPHTWHSDPAGGRVESVVVQFSAQALADSVGGLPEYAPIARLLERSRRGLCLAGPPRARVRPLLQALPQTPAGSMERVTALLSILALLAGGTRHRPLSLARPEPARDPGTHDRLAQTLARLHADDHEMPPAQAALAAQVGMSPAAFARFFRRQMGKTYRQYANDVRVGRACRLLLETDASVAEVAFRAGFGNLANFNRRFRERKQITPVAYRRLRGV